MSHDGVSSYGAVSRHRPRSRDATLSHNGALSHDGSRDRIAVLGTGYVGLTTGACLAAMGHPVVCADVDRTKLAELARGEVRPLEPGLGELVREGIDAEALTFTADAAGAVRGCTVVFLCLPTPTGADGAVDLSAVESVVRGLRDRLPRGCVLAVKSTVPVGTAAHIADLLGRADVAVVSNPEFLREGSAVHDFLHPDRVVLGADRASSAADRVAELYAPLGAPVVRTDPASAELVKHAANSYLALKLSYTNALAEVCERAGADVAALASALGQDPRIGGSCLRPGPSWGGSCLPKDTRALARAADERGVDSGLLRAALAANEREPDRAVRRIAAACGERGQLRDVRLGVLGLAFKAGTNDLRESPALSVARRLADRGADLLAHDPGLRGDEPELAETVTVVGDAYQAAKGAAGLVVLTDWPQFRELDWTRIAGLLHRPVVVDARNHLDPEVLARAGLSRQGTGFGQ